MGRTVCLTEASQEGADPTSRCHHLGHHDYSAFPPRALAACVTRRLAFCTFVMWPYEPSTEWPYPGSSFRGRGASGAGAPLPLRCLDFAPPCFFALLPGLPSPFSTRELTSASAASISAQNRLSASLSPTIHLPNAHSSRARQTKTNLSRQRRGMPQEATLATHRMHTTITTVQIMHSTTSMSKIWGLRDMERRSVAPPSDRSRCSSHRVNSIFFSVNQAKTLMIHNYFADVPVLLLLINSSRVTGVQKCSQAHRMARKRAQQELVLATLVRNEGARTREFGAVRAPRQPVGACLAFNMVRVRLAAARVPLFEGVKVGQYSYKTGCGGGTCGYRRLGGYRGAHSGCEAFWWRGQRGTRNRHGPRPAGPPVSLRGFAAVAVEILV